MSPLAITAWILGTLAVGVGLFSACSPAWVRQGLRDFPRSIWPGRILLAVDMVWAAYAVTTLHLGGFDALKIHLYWLVPVCIVLGSLYLDELLSVRALGGLRAAGVDHHDPRAPCASLIDETHLVDVRLGDVLAPQHDQSGVR